MTLSVLPVQLPVMITLPSKRHDVYSWVRQMWFLQSIASAAWPRLCFAQAPPGATWHSHVWMLAPVPSSMLVLPPLPQLPGPEASKPVQPPPEAEQ